MSGGGNPNHDPKTGEFTSGDGGGGGSAFKPAMAQALGMKQDSKAQFDVHMAEVQKNIDALKQSQKTREPERQKFNSIAQKVFGTRTKVRL